MRLRTGTDLDGHGSRLVIANEHTTPDSKQGHLVLCIFLRFLSFRLSHGYVKVPRKWIQKVSALVARIQYVGRRYYTNRIYEHI